MKKGSKTQAYQGTNHKTQDQKTAQGEADITSFSKERLFFVVLTGVCQTEAMLLNCGALLSTMPYLIVILSQSEIL